MWQISADPELKAKESAAGIKQVSEQREAANAAFNQLYRMDEMDKQFANLPTQGFLVPGSYAKERQEFAKSINMMTNVLHGKPIFDPNQVAANESLLKDTFRLGTELVRGMGKEPGFIVQSAVSANPGIENTPMAYRRIMSGLREAARYEQDKSAFFDSYFSTYATLSGANEQFAKLNPPSNYAKRAIISTIDKNDLDAFTRQIAKNNKNKVPSDKAIAVFNEIYGADSHKYVLGQ